MKVSVCPACNSQDIGREELFKFELRSGLMRERCGNCGYLGPMTVMEKKGADRLRVAKLRRKRPRLV